MPVPPPVTIPTLPFNSPCKSPVEQLPIAHGLEKNARGAMAYSTLRRCSLSQVVA